MNKIYSIVASVLLVFMTVACDSFNSALNVNDISTIKVEVKTVMSIQNVDSIEELKISFDNYAEDLHIVKTMSDSVITVEGLLPGLYSINISGKVKDAAGDEYYVNGSKINYAVVKDAEVVDISVSGLKISPLIFSEIFYAGTTPYYFRNQFYEIYNNSSNTIYLDGIYFANLYPTTATKTLPQWPTEDEGVYAHAERVWKFPGTGKDYPLKAGESVVVSQFAANHKLPAYCPASPVDCSSSEFEFNMNNPNYPDQPAVDMVHVFYNGSASKGTVPQYLTSVFGGAFVLLRIPEGVSWNPVTDLTMRTRDLPKTSTTLYAKIPIQYVLDAVEAGQNETMMAAKRVPGVLDAGMTYVGSTYNSLGVARKKIAVNSDGTPVLQDTNNSTDDFDRGVVPVFRRYDSKMPSWNHTLGDK